MASGRNRNSIDCLHNSALVDVRTVYQDLASERSAAASSSDLPTTKQFQIFHVRSEKETTKRSGERNKVSSIAANSSFQPNLLSGLVCRDLVYHGNDRNTRLNFSQSCFGERERCF